MTTTYETRTPTINGRLHLAIKLFRNDVEGDTSCRNLVQSWTLPVEVAS